MKALVLTLEGSAERRWLERGTLSVGRAPDSDWVLAEPGPNPRVSRRHCRFAIGPEGASVTDLGSTNGTLVDGRALSPRVPTPLRGGELVEIGARRLRVELPDAAQADTALPAPSFAARDQPIGLEMPTSPHVGPPQQKAPETGPDTPFDLFAAESEAAPREGLVREDPLAGAFSEELRPPRLGGRATPARERTRPRDDAPPHLEALLVRSGGAPRSEPPARPAVGIGTDPLAGVQPPAEPPRSAPAPAPAPPSPSAGAGPLAAFVEGAGLEAAIGQGKDPAAFLHEAGQVFAHLANGLRELLAVRALIKEQAGVDRTQISASHNNPLKLSVTAREATAALLGGREEGYLAPVAAVDAGFRDLKAHELAVLDGVQSAVGELLELFDPATLERTLDDAGTLVRLMQGGQRARLWELYQARYGEIAKAARRRFMGRLDDAFRTAYTRKVAEMATRVEPSLGPLSRIPPP